MKTRIFSFLVFMLISSSVQAEGVFSPLDSFHNNNNLWTGFDPLNGDIGNSENSSMEYPGGSSIDHLLRGCHSIGFLSPSGDTVVVSNKLC
ncbi:hypothetical protein JXA84_01190 [candidate division WOR-3 bacterium]|nr:hypothetical protein [candidate division WOR-3 bacterium]